jgi:hypothetical protein
MVVRNSSFYVHAAIHHIFLESRGQYSAVRALGLYLSGDRTGFGQARPAAVRLPGTVSPLKVLRLVFSRSSSRNGRIVAIFDVEIHRSLVSTIGVFRKAMQCRPTLLKPSMADDKLGQHVFAAASA